MNMTNYLRETSTRERSMFFQGTRNPVFFGFRILAEGPITPEKLKAGLKHNQKRFPQFGAVVHITAEKKQFLTTENCPDIPVVQVELKDGSWEEILARVISLPFCMDAEPPVKIYRRDIPGEKTTELFFVFHHAVCDGLSGILFIDTLFRFISGQNIDLPFGEVNPEITDLMTDEDIRDFKTRELPEWFRNRPPIDNSLTASMQVFNRKEFIIHSFPINSEMSNGIISAAKENGSTVHAVIGAAFLQAFAEEFGEKEGFRRTIQSPVNLRPLLKKEAVLYPGCYIGIIKAEADCTPGKKIWEIARDIKTGFLGETENKKHLYPYFVYLTQGLEGIKDPEAFFEQRSPWPMDYDFSLSNLGNISLRKTYGLFCIHEVYGPTFSAANGERVIGFNTFRDSIRFTFIHEKDCFSGSAAQRIINTALESLESIIP